MNICRNIWFSLASAAIISACIFLFCVFYSIITNVQYMVVTAESTMGITVFFDESLPEDEIHAIGDEIRKAQGPIIKDMKFTPFFYVPCCLPPRCRSRGWYVLKIRLQVSRQ